MPRKQHFAASTCIPVIADCGGAYGWKSADSESLRCCRGIELAVEIKRSYRDRARVFQEKANEDPSASVGERVGVFSDERKRSHLPVEAHPERDPEILKRIPDADREARSLITQRPAQVAAIVAPRLKPLGLAGHLFSADRIELLPVRQQASGHTIDELRSTGRAAHATREGRLDWPAVRCAGRSGRVTWH